MKSDKLTPNRFVQSRTSTLQRVLVVIALVLAWAPALLAQNPPPRQTFYLPLPEDDLLVSLNVINGDADEGPIYRLTTIAIGTNGAYVYFDQGENGYVSDIANPTAGEIYSNPGNLNGVQIWGDADASNGAPPNIASDVLYSGSVIELENTVGDFDGGDKLAVAGVAGMVMLAYPSNVGTVFCGGTEVLDTSTFGTDFLMVVGVTPGSGDDWEATEGYFIASQDGTTIYRNSTSQGTFDEGESLKLTGLNRGDNITASAPIGAIQFTGNIGSTYEMRWEAMMPTSQWTNSYILPGIDGDVTNVDYPKTQRVFFYAENPTTVTYRLGTGATGTITADNTNTLTDGTANWYTVPEGTGARFTSPSGTTFWGVSVVGQVIDDEGVPLVPTSAATEAIIVPQGLGCTDGDCSPVGDLSADRSAVFITPDVAWTSSTTLYVDFDGLVGPRSPATYTVGGLDTIRLLDSDQDMTGALIYTLDTDANLTGIWLQFSTTNSDPDGLDLGTLTAAADGMRDFGDAPTSYGTAGHRVISGLSIGPTVDYEVDYSGGATALLDDDQYTGGSTIEYANVADSASSTPVTVTTSYTGPVVPIPDQGTANVPLSVSGLSDTITDVNLRIDGTSCSTDEGSTTVGIDHTYLWDLQVSLISPAGTSVMLINRRGGGGNNFCQTLLDDEGSNPVSGGSAPFTGTFTPDNALSAFDGENPNGSWTLRVVDNAGRDTGNVRAFSVIITTGSSGGVSNPGNATGANDDSWTGDIDAGQRLSLQVASGMSAGDWFRIRARSSDGSSGDETATVSFCSAANSGCATNTVALTVEDPENVNPGPDKYYDFEVPTGVTGATWLRIVGGSGTFQVDCAATMITTPMDDEDGVELSFGSEILTATVTATNTTGSAGRLCGYLDGGVNSLASTVTVNGTFERNAGAGGGAGPGNGNLEERCVDVPNGTNAGTFALSWYFPATEVTTSYVRLRLSTDASFLSDSSPSPTEPLGSGEVEDYRVTVSPTYATVSDVRLELASVRDVVAALTSGGGDLRAALAVLAPEALTDLPENADETELLRALAAFLDPDGDGNVAVVRWQTVGERGTIGFYLERADSRGVWDRVNQGMMRGLIAPMGGEYLLADPQARAGGTYRYLLIEREAWGTLREHGPYTLVLE